MYIRETKTPSGEKYLHLVESRRINGKVKQSILLSLGKESDNIDEHLLNQLAKRRGIVTLSSALDSLEIKNSYHYGVLFLFEKLFKKFGLTSALEDISQTHSKLQFNFNKAIFTMVVSRFLSPSSKLHIYDHLAGQFFPGIYINDLDLHHYYRSLDILSQHKDKIESQLLKYNKRHKNISTDVLLYDLTTLRFESTRTKAGELPQYGYSKEKRSDCTQVVLGLVVDTEGIPLFFDVFPGNTYEGSTIKDISEKLKKKFDVRRFILVADRGLFSKSNLEEIQNTESQDDDILKEFPFEYIVGLKMAALKKNAEDFYDISKYTSINEELAFYETQYEDKRCVLTWSKTRAERDKKVREDIINKIQKKLTSKTKATHFVSNTNYKKFIKGLDSGSPELNFKAIEEESKRDGFFGVITNIPKDVYTAEMIIGQYKSLWIIEDAFGEIKGTLKARPIFHWTDERIKGHIIMCYLAYFCEAQITKVFRNKKITNTSKSSSEGLTKERALTCVQFMDSLKNLKAIEIKIADKTFYKTTPADENIKQGLAALEIPLPEKTLLSTM